VQQGLIAEIWRTSLWTVTVTVDGNISKPDKTDFIERDSSYIILIEDDNFRTLGPQLLGLLEYKSPRFWKSEVRFVVAVASEFSMSHQRGLFDIFSKFKIYNCIIVSQEHYVIDKEYS
jgi:hypothetical protein